MPNPCSRGCKADDGVSPKIHIRVADCPIYQAELKAAQEAVQREKAAKPQPDKPAAPATPPPKGKPGTIEFSGGVAEVRKGSTTPTPPPEPVDFVVDGPHTRTAWTMGYRAIKFATYLLDDYLETDKIHQTGFTQHIPDRLFRLNQTELDAIDGDPQSNPFTRLATWVTKRFGAKTQLQAHAMIDTANFGMLFGGLFYAVYDHYKVAIKFSPKLIAMREKKIADKKARASPEDSEETALRSLAGPGPPVGAPA
ncbi:MAG: hypothetical protein L3K23_10650 [Thermoplasmata archaeon]|nr:hypothetical protein [Thermoplasmata archaeon]